MPMRAFALCLLCSASSALADPTPLTLSEARRNAAEHNHDVLAAQDAVELAHGNTASTTELPNPTVGLGYARQRIAPLSFHDRSVSISQPIAISGRLGLAGQVGRASEAAAESRLADALRTTDAALVKAYAEAVAANRSMAALKETAQAYRHEAEIARKRQAAGDLAEIEAARILLAAESAETDAGNAAIRTQAALVALETLMGTEHPQGKIVVADSLDDLRGACVKTYELPDLPRPDVVAARHEQDAAEAGVELEHANRWADPSVSLAYDRNTQGPANTVGLAISIPIPLLNQNNGAIRSARARATMAANELARVTAQHSADLAASETAWRIAAQTELRHRETLLPAARKIAEAAQAAYDKGGIALIDYLATTRDYNAERLAAIQSTRDLVAASADLAAAKGQTLPKLSLTTK